MDEMDRSTFGHDESHDERRDVQAEIQDVLDELQREMAGASVENVTVAINRRFADAGIPEQPHRWVQSMAERISTSRPAVADTAAAVDAVRRAESGPDDERVDSGPGVGIVEGAPQDADGNPAHDPTEMTGGPAAGPLGHDETLPDAGATAGTAEPESVEPGAVPESQATPPPANPR